MLEKNSHLVLTDDDVKQYNDGVVSERIKQTWGPISVDELRELIATNQVTINSNIKGII